MMTPEALEIELARRVERAESERQRKLAEQARIEAERARRQAADELAAEKAKPIADRFAAAAARASEPEPNPRRSPSSRRRSRSPPKLRRKRNGRGSRLGSWGRWHS
jgi:hypothetical protein